MKYIKVTKYIMVLMIALLVSLVAIPCFAEVPNGVPKLIEYIGNLEKANGSPYPGGTYNINFQICTDASCTSSIWSETHSVVISAKNKKDIDGGTSYEAAYEVILGSIISLDSIVFDKDYYLKISEATQGYSNIEQLKSVPYAMRADFANYAETVYDSDDGQYKNLQDITINKAKDADTTDNIHASATPEANKLLALDGSAELPNVVLKTGHGRGLDADTTDNIHASAMPEANNLLALDPTSQFPNSVLKMGEGNGINADMVDGAHHSDITKEIGDNVTAHAGSTTTHGVIGEIVGTNNNQVLTNKHISGEQIDSGKISNDRLKLGEGNNLDADTVDGKHASYFAIATHTHSFGQITGTISDSQVPNDITINYASSAGSASYANNAGYANSAGSASSASYASSAGNADTVDGYHASSFMNPGSYYACSGDWTDSVHTHDLLRADLPNGWGCDYCRGWFEKHTLDWTTCWIVYPDGSETAVDGWHR